MVSGTSVMDVRQLSMAASPCAFNVKNMFASNVQKEKNPEVKVKKRPFAISATAQKMN